MSTHLKLYTAGTPNGHKVTILLELLGLEYDTQKLNFSTSEQKEEWFIKLNPNGRIPTLVDSSTNTTLSETAAILQYLVDTYDKDNKFSYKVGTPLYYKQLEVLYFQMAGIGPMFGQLGHFKITAKDKIPYAIERYENESKRLISVVDEYLKRNKENGLFLVGDHLSIADIAIFSWMVVLHRGDLTLDSWPLTAQWYESIAGLSAVKAGLSKP
ncbi:putative glutathione S-transferase-like protein Gedep [[Candida] railenensis]|uniref:Glutathione S-transferase-like protein Gedep n=1 Tax=[Candida] railenensis TaxID=45579 RepID=A0A9P0QRX7_9ASCO|nr:putative glutathione S-transferase-like protein Gedep [[Candida] railenensis]